MKKHHMMDARLGDARRDKDGQRSPYMNVLASVIVVTLPFVITGCATYHNIKGRLELQNDQTVQGIESLETATRKAPTDPEFKLDYLRAREENARTALARADALRADGKLAEAKAAYELVLKMDRGNARAATALTLLPQDARFDRLLSEGELYLSQGRMDIALERAQQVLDIEPQHRRAVRLKETTLDAKADQQITRSRAQVSKSLLDRPVTLQFNDAPLRVVFEALSKSVGLNILLDRDLKPTAKVSIFVKDISVGDAMDFILLQNQLERRSVNENTVIVFPSSESKKSEYEDLSIRSFRVTNADIKYLAAMLKSMLKIREISGDERSGILVLRDTPEKLRLAAKLIAVHDVPDPEIMLEVEILEVSTTRTSNLGIVPPSSFTVTTPGAQAGALTWGALRSLHRDDLLVSPLSATLNFKLQDADAKLLASPRIRARNKEKARILIGDRVPTIINTVTPIATGSSVVTGNVSYQEVGLKLEFEPQVYANQEVGIKMALEVSNIAAEFTDAQGGRSYQIGTRNATTNLRLKDGETQILGGLITDQDRNLSSKIPGLGHLPVIGRLFGNNDGTDTRSEIVLAITPRIVRNLPEQASELRDIFSGTLNVPREKPILAEPITLVKGSPLVGGNAGDQRPGSTNPGAPNSPVSPPVMSSNVSPPAAAAPASAPPPQTLGVPPPMFVRPAPGGRP